MVDHNVAYFKKILSQERKKLTNLCKQWQNVLQEHSDEKTLPEHAHGEIRTTIGLTELLLNQKLKQFGDLIRDCENGTGEIKVMCTDLQGFWEMVYFEVEKVNTSFNKLETMKRNNWEIKEETVEVKEKKVKLTKPKVSQPVKASSATKAHILAARQRLAEAKAKAMKSNASSVADSNKENFISVSTAGSTIKDDAISISVAKKVQTVGESDVQTPSTKNRTGKNKKAKEIPPLSCITRSAKRALAEKNQGKK